MSLEQEINDLRGAIVRLTAIIQAQSSATVTTSAPVDYAEAARKAVEKANVSYTIPAVPVADPVPVAPPPPLPPPPAPAMPAPPSFVAAPAPAPSSTLPFSDAKGLIEYVMQAYKEMGRDKGASIGDVLTKMGLKAINEVQPSQYAEFHAAVEALK